MTVLFCDLVGSTSFGEQVDPETARETMARYHEMARQAIEGNGGTLAKFIGDGVMALFGVPEVGEDDALRAVRTGVELQHRFAPLGDRITQRHGVEVGLRVGINTGELVVADDDDDIVGDAVNTAARLESECVPGRVLVGEDTWRLTRSAVQYEVLGEVSVKGKQDPIATFQVVDETNADDEMLTPFVGRDREVEALRAEFELAGEGKLRSTGDGDRCPRCRQDPAGARSSAPQWATVGGSSRCAANAPAPPRSRRSPSSCER